MPLRSLTRKPTSITSSSTTSSSEITRRPTLFQTRTTKTPNFRLRKPAVKPGVLVAGSITPTVSFTRRPFIQPGSEKINCTSNPHSVKCKLFGPSKFGLVKDNHEAHPTTATPTLFETLKITKKPSGLIKLKQFTTSTPESPRSRPLKPRKKGKEISNQVVPDTDHGPSETPLAPVTPVTPLAPEQGPVTMCGVGAADCHPDHHLISNTIKTISPTDDCATDNNTDW